MERRRGHLLILLHLLKTFVVVVVVVVSRYFRTVNSIVLWLSVRFGLKCHGNPFFLAFFLTQSNVLFGIWTLLIVRRDCCSSWCKPTMLNIIRYGYSCCLLNIFRMPALPFCRDKRISLYCTNSEGCERSCTVSLILRFTGDSSRLRTT